MNPVALVVAIAAAALAACSSPPVVRLHSLLAAPAESAARDANASKISVELGTIGVPASVDQPQWLVRINDESLRLLEQEQWAAPLRDELRAAVWHQLRTKFGAVDPHVAPGVPSWRVQIDIHRFESITGKEAWVEAAWSIASTARDNKTSLACHSSIREPAAGDVSALASAHRRIAARLTDQIGGALQALARGTATACTP